MSKAGQAPGRRARAYAYTVVTTTVVLIFALAEWAVERYVTELSKAATAAIEAGIVLIAAVVFRPIHQRVEAAIEGAFNKRKHQALSAIAHLRRELTSFNDMTQLLRRVLETLEQQMDASACAVYLRRELFHAEASSFDLAAEDVDPSDPLPVRLRSSSAPARPERLNSAARGTHAFPLTLRGELIGFLSVQHKHGDYDDDEMQMLAGLGQDLAIALAALDPRLRLKRDRTPHNIPADIPRITGRERELNELRAALSKSRLVTITGTGGVGKTALALRCAADTIAEHQDGAWFVNLAPIRDASVVAPTLLATLGGGAAESGDDEERLIEHLQPRDALIVIDNCEQVVARTARLIARIRAACPDITILATSRELLRLDGEQVYRLGPLNSDDAVELFAQRAAAVSPGFDARQHENVVRSLCAHLDGVPLAIELAAARTRVLSVEETLVHLNERFRLLKSTAPAVQPRQQTLAATIEWSYDLLSGEEKSLFRRLGVFRGSFSLAAAAAVCGRQGECDEYHVLDLLTSLADKSLLVAQVAVTTRYRLLETIREFAVQKAAEHNEMSESSSQHAAYFSQIAAHAYHEFDSRLPPGWLSRLSPDIDNFRAALDWTLGSGNDACDGARLAADCGPVFLRMELLSEGLRWCDAARAVPQLSPQTAGRIDYVASMMHNNRGDTKRALECAQRALECYLRTSDERGTIRALSQVAQLYARSDRFEEAKLPAAEAIRRARSLREPRVLISVLRRCAFSLPDGDKEEARRCFTEALETARSVHEPEEECMVLQWWAAKETAWGAIERGIELATQGLACADPDTTLYLEGQIAGSYATLGRFDDAAPHVTAALRLALQREHPLRALLMAYYAAVHARRDPREACVIYGYARARLDELGWEPQADDQAALDNVTAEIERGLNDEDYASLLVSGASVTDDEALRLISAALNT